MQYTVILMLVFAGCKGFGKDAKPMPSFSANDSQKNEFLANRMDSLIKLASVYNHNNGLNEEIAFFADLSMHSGLPRFAVVDLKQHKILKRGLVAHGCGGSLYAVNASFSNKPNSNCSSLGKYKIGGKYKGQFGNAYKLHGLDKTNSNAYQRAVVLHAYGCVPDIASYPVYTCNSKGCPMVSYKFLATLAGYVDGSKKPLLLWIVN